MTIDTRKQERFWNQLLTVVSKGTMVPVVGEGLLQIPGDSAGRSLYEGLAGRYCEMFGISLDPEQQANLSAAIRKHPDFATDPHDVYQALGDEYEAWSPAIPESLRLLARIRHFNLFISTTFDNLLERALNDERFDGKPLTEVITYSPKNVPDEHQMAEQLSTGRPVVFQIFGSCRTPLQFALTEGDRVEYMHALQTAEYRPKRVFAEVYDRPLLLLGNRFPDWLMRMFLRMVRRTALDHREVPKQYVLEVEALEDPFYGLFLKSFATNTELVEEMKPIPFVAELSRRWSDRFGHEPVPVAPPARVTSTRAMPRNAVFISYCATDASGQVAKDAAAAMAMRDALEARGIDVWLDKDQLQGGDEFERRIQRYVQTCSLFMPLISTTTESRDDGFFRKEWSWALAKLAEFTGSNREYLFPVLLDPLNPYSAKIPDEFKRVQFSSMVDCAPDPRLIDRVQGLYEKTRGSAGGSCGVQGGANDAA